MKKLVVGIMAHVDAGKTTLSEAMLYTSGSIRKMGRVDNQDAFLDTYSLERERGITIFSKQALFSWKDVQFTLLDTPGHVDFSAEMERTLQVLDYAILVVSGADGVQGHTQTLWHLLKHYKIPTFVFVNKMDQPGTERERRLLELQNRLDSGCIDFRQEENELQDEIAMCEENAMEHFLAHGRLEKEQIQKLIAERKVFPCFFGSALRLEGIEELMNGMAEYALEKEYPNEFGAKVFKIARDEQGKRLTYLKVTGGTLKVKDLLCNQEKVNQIRIYSGEKYESPSEVEAGGICAVTGLTKTYAGEGLGCDVASGLPFLEPVLNYQILLPEGMDAAVMLPKLHQLEEEEPELHIVWNEELREIQAQVMGEVQLEVLQSLIQERFGVEVSFGTGNIVYKETIRTEVEGVGHFEPLRHYAEVHLLLEPGEPGSGMQYETDCSEDILDKNWQRLIYTHLTEREQRGVLTGSVLTDTKITLVTGRAHQKHTEGGDFRQATYRAIRQGLMQAESVLLEPYYEFRVEVPTESVGRVMTDIEKRFGVCQIQENDGELSVLTGSAPVATMQDYPKELNAYTKGRGRIFCSIKGYETCHNQEEVVAAKGYDPERDLAYTPDSVFCAHGAGFVVPWYEVPDYMHVESCFALPKKELEPIVPRRDKQTGGLVEEAWIGTDEIDAILAKTFDANRRTKGVPRNGYKKTSRSDVSYPTVRSYQNKSVKQEEYLLVDGYNVIFAWEELKELAEANMDSARGKLLDMLCNYQGIRKCQLIVVFDAYRVAGHETEISDYHNIHVVFTKEAETADQYIEKFAHEHAKNYRVTVATSDGLEQIIIRGEGCGLISSRELREEMERANLEVCGEFERKQESARRYLLDEMSEEQMEELQKSIQEE
ncbi:MAG: NYN domain-containing protein [Roseburia sp.]